MKFIKTLPFESVIGDTVAPVGLFESEENICELIHHSGCDTSGRYYGTEDEREPKFCARHYYQEIVSGDGQSNYKLIDIR